ncbi:UNVERIFIED_CONTAM: hypothetical protein Sradi_1764600 [Sesamum radiatum]|uniref:Phorbol-ester/DAG-type domain-containing protein n=1 Tax=Sesamum radiatum TaxID=300843 RepID=A0AAW2TUT4_SESRA
MCDGCKTKGIGERYQCALCGDELHRECKFPLTTVSHEFFGCSMLTFRDKPCTRYGKNNWEKYSNNAAMPWFSYHSVMPWFSYHSAADNLDLHPTCPNLDRKLVIDDMVFDLVKIMHE